MATTPQAATLERIKTILRRDLKLGANAPIPDDMPFFGADTDLDSLDILLLVTTIEKEFGIRIPSEQVGREAFQSPQALAEFVEATSLGSGAVAVLPDYLGLLPHREPFRFVSRVLRIEPGAAGEAIWAVAGTEPFLAGHFPGQPLVPGVLIAEALAQLSGLVGASVLTGTSNQPPHGGKLAQVEMRFHEAVAPPAQIVLHSALTRTLGALQQFDVQAICDSRIVAQGSLALAYAVSQSPSEGQP